MKFYFLKKNYLEEVANVVAGIDKTNGVNDDSDDKFKAVKTHSSVIINLDTEEETNSRIRKILQKYKTNHISSIFANATNPLRPYMAEDVQGSPKLTKKDLSVVERYADQLFHTIGIDITFTNHFLDRANDSRNGRQITVHELVHMFNKQFSMNGAKLKKVRSDTEAVLKDIKSDIASPVYFEYDRRIGMMEMRLKTTYRKKDFRTSDPVYKA